ncbi:MAG: glucosidase [Chloroflexota bacterium]|nr:MAG: glucosidase [Chloroflexota bacterium]
MSKEKERLIEVRERDIPWRKWGPYLSERQWGTVREDYSDNEDAWNYFPHDHARSRVYKWGEDGLAGFCDDKQRLCWGLGLWNGVDPILKERLFGLNNAEGNHGEDVKEYYFYLDSTPTHSYMKFLYKYPQGRFPYEQLVDTNRQRTREGLEYELIDTGIFDEDRYFDIQVEYAKASPEDILIQISVTNRGPESAQLHLLPQLWFRNTWWLESEAQKPSLERGKASKGASALNANHPTLGAYTLYCQGSPKLLFTENETNRQRLFAEQNLTPYVKDAFHEYLVNGNEQALNPAEKGTKSAASYLLNIPSGETEVIWLRLCQGTSGAGFKPFDGEFEKIFKTRRKEADEFYQHVIPSVLNEDQRNVMRQAVAGMLWSKQYYFFDLDIWLEEHGANPLLGGRRHIRNRDWYHMLNDNVISMPDKWEYPWYAAWDLAFHTLVFNLVDPDFAKEQLDLMLRDVYLHPNGQIPAYEWNFSDVNPPVHAWATYFNYLIGENLGLADLDFLKNTFNKLLLNFNWWVNRKDPGGRNLFSGGFLGLDNIGVFDRSAPLPTGGYLEQADGTAWMAFFSQNMLSIALEIARHDPTYEDMVLKFVQHFLWIAGSMDRVGDNQDELWDEEDGFFYDVLVMPDGSGHRIRVHSMVGLLPLTAVAVIEPEIIASMPDVVERVRAFINKRPELVANIHPISKPGVDGRRLLSILNESKLRRVLEQMLDEDHFLSPYGIRSLSRWHLDHPYTIKVHGEEYQVQYLPAESNTGLFGGNSNWRGPVWFPVNALLIRALLVYYSYYGDDFKVEFPTRSGQMMTLYQVAKEIALRLARIFERDGQGMRPVFGGAEKFQEDPHWRDHLLFYEYFHGDNGAGLGASHQTGWTGVVAVAYKLFGNVPAERYLRAGPVLRLVKDN